MANKNEQLFEESSRGTVSALTAVFVIVSLGLFYLGLYLMAAGFDSTLETSVQLWLFVGGLVASFLAFFLPFSVLPAIGK